MMKNCFIALALILLMGCSNGNYVVVNVHRNGRALIQDERLAVSELSTRLLDVGCNTNSFVFITSSPFRTNRFTNNTIFIQHGKDWSHAQLRDVMDRLEVNEVGSWPDSLTVKTEDAQRIGAR